MKTPADWKFLALNDLIADLEAGVSVNGEDEPAGNGEVGVLKVSAVSSGRFVPSQNKRILGHEIARAAVKPRKGSILVSRSNTPLLVGDNALVSTEHSHLFLPDKLWQIVFRKHAPVDATWLSKVLQTKKVRTQLIRLATGTSNSMKNISKPAFLSLEILAPPLPEQKRMAALFASWDDALEKLAALIAAKDRRKKALMQQLLTGKRRLPGAKAWKRVLLADVAEECGERNRETLDRSRLFAVTKAAGMVPMRENVQGATINRCKLVEPGWFAYNPMRINIGSIARWEGTAPVMVSPDYVVFRAKEERLLSDYLNHVRQAAPWADFVGASGNGSVRVRIWFDDLGRFKLPLPSLPEQRAIAAVLNTADAELRLLRDQRAALDQQKRGLMQQLLTGQKRVTIN